MAFDVLYRYLVRAGYDVTYVRNFTDVDDKILARAALTGQPPLELANRFADEFLEVTRMGRTGILVSCAFSAVLCFSRSLLRAM